jgi:hypothetical protein
MFSLFSACMPDDSSLLSLMINTSTTQGIIITSMQTSAPSDDITRQVTPDTYSNLRISISRAQRAATPVRVYLGRDPRKASIPPATQGHQNIQGQHSRSTACSQRENTAVMSTQGDAGIPLSLLAEDRQHPFRLLELPPELLKLLTSDNPPT